jgi:short-subunit dehydrogenase
VQLDGATALLTGATGGIGHAIARELGARGASLVLTGRRAEVLRGLADELDARALEIDLSVPAEVDRLLEQAGEVDVLVANAALPASGPLEGFGVGEIDRALEVNLRAPIVLARALVPRMVAARRGHLVFVSSVAAKVTAPGSTIYCASKYGLRGFAGALRTELAGTGVGVSAVFPGFIRDAGMFAETGVRLPRFVPTRSPEDVARAVVSAIEHDRGEVDVMPVSLRASALLANVDLVSDLGRRLGAERLSASIAAGQREKR